MKQEIPKPVIVVCIALAAGVGIFFLTRAGAPPVIPGPEIEVGAQAVPEYLRDRLPPEVQAQIEAESRRLGTVTERATEMGARAPGPPQGT